VGRPAAGHSKPWGNEYSHKEGTLAKFKTKTVEEAVYKHAIDFLSDPSRVALSRPLMRARFWGAGVNQTAAQ
jgi:hypothetical protein